MRLRVICVISAALLTACGASAMAQTIVTPAANTVFRAGPDFASDVLQDPWDFSNVEDVSPNPDEFGGWATSPANLWNAIGTGQTFVNTATGRFQGTANGDNQLVMLYRGDAIGLNPGRSGIRYPIDTSRYRKFAMKITYTGVVGDKNKPVVYWYHVPAFADNFLNRAGGAVLPNHPIGDSTTVQIIDLASASNLTPACGGAGCTGTPAAWEAESHVSGFRIDPTTEATPVGVQIDWVRLTASDGAANAAMMTVTYNSCTGTPTLSVRDAAGFDTPVATGSAGSATFNYGVFPPGSYNLVLQCNEGATLQPFSINAPPHVTVIDPDESGDETTDFAFTSSGGTNRWDFEEASVSDIIATANVSTTAGACAGGGCGVIASDAPGAAPGSKMLRASSIGTPGSQLGDPALDFLGGRTVPVSSLRNRYLTFSLRINRPYDVAVGSVARMLWGSQNFTDQSVTTTSQDMRVWPGFHKYTIDLGALSAASGGIETDCLAESPPCLTTPWSTRSIRFFRIDPHEFGDVPTSFDIDDVSLAAPDEVNLSGSGAGSSFTIRWSVADPDSTDATYQTRVFLDTDRDPSSGLTQILGPLATTLATNQVAWTPPATTAPGTYYVYVETTETRPGMTNNVSAHYSSGPLVIYSSTASSPQISVSSPVANTTVPFPFTITGCAYDAGNTAGINMDDLAVFAIAGTGVTGVAPGSTFALGFSATDNFGVLEYAPLTPATPVACPSISDPTSPFRNSGFRINNVGLQQGPWTLRVYARSTISGLLTPLADIPINVTQLSLGPTNFQVSATGNIVTVSWGPPTGGPPVTGYVIDVALDAAFNVVAANVVVPASVLGGSGSLPNGTFFLRVVSLAGAGSRQTASETRSVTLPAGGAPPPGPPVLTATQVTTNPVIVSWAPGTGGAPTSYTLLAGTSSGLADIGAIPMGTATSISAVAPLGLRIFLRVQATNAAGSAISNEINFLLTPPPPPGAPVLNPATVSGGVVNMSWSPGPGAAPTSYTLVARLSATGPIIASVPGLSTSLSVPAPSGTYFVSVIAVNSAGSSAESNQITVVVP